MSDIHARKAIIMAATFKKLIIIKTLLVRNCNSTSASSTRTKPPRSRHESIKGQVRFVATEYRQEQRRILEVRGGGHSSSRSRGGRRGVDVVMADLSKGINSMVCGKGQSRDCDTARLSTSGFLFGGISIANQLPGFEEYSSSGT